MNVLSSEQQHLSDRFAHKAGPGEHGLSGIPQQTRVTGAPIIDGGLAYIDCRVVESYQGGDHTIFVGEVADAGRLDGQEPLIFYGGRYTRLA